MNSSSNELYICKVTRDLTHVKWLGTILNVSEQKRHKLPRQIGSKVPANLPVATRERILDVAQSMIAIRGNAAISLVEVAQEAGVSRQTLYLLFGGRAGMLLALVDHIDAKSAAPGRLKRVSESLHGRQAIRPYVKEWLEYVPDVFPVARALSAAAAAGDEAAQAAWESRMKMVYGGFRLIARSLQDSGDLREGWTPAAAAQWMYGLTQVDMWQHFVVESKWKPTEMLDRVIAAIESSVLRQKSVRGSK